MTMKAQTLLPLIALGLAVSGCGGTANRGLSSVHQPVVARADYSFDLGAGNGGIGGAETARLAGWFDALQLGYGDRVSVDLPGGYDSSGAREQVAAVAARYGLLLQDTPPVTSGDVPLGAVRVIVSRLKASVPGCPDRSRSMEINFNHHGDSNYGCATNSNLAAMIANPEDLIQGQTGNGTDGTAAATKAIKAYREAPTTGTRGLTRESAGEK
jgi:pilus assembly protein CpaD